MCSLVGGRLGIEAPDCTDMYKIHVGGPLVSRVGRPGENPLFIVPASPKTSNVPGPRSRGTSGCWESAQVCICTVSLSHFLTFSLSHFVCRYCFSMLSGLPHATASAVVCRHRRMVPICNTERLACVRRDERKARDAFETKLR